MMIQTVQDHLLMLALRWFLAYVTPKAIAPNSDPLFPSAFELCTTADFPSTFGLAATLFKKPYSQLLHYSVGSGGSISTQADWLIFLVQALQQTNGASSPFPSSCSPLSNVPSCRLIVVATKAQSWLVTYGLWCAAHGTRDLNESIDRVRVWFTELLAQEARTSLLRSSRRRRRGREEGQVLQPVRIGPPAAHIVQQTSSGLYVSIPWRLLMLTRQLPSWPMPVNGINHHSLYNILHLMEVEDGVQEAPLPACRILRGAADLYGSSRAARLELSLEVHPPVRSSKSS